MRHRLASGQRPNAHGGRLYIVSPCESHVTCATMFDLDIGSTIDGIKIDNVIGSGATPRRRTCRRSRPPGRQTGRRPRRGPPDQPFAYLVEFGAHPVDDARLPEDHRQWWGGERRPPWRPSCWTAARPAWAAPSGYPNGD